MKRIVPLLPSYIFAKFDLLCEHNKARWTPDRTENRRYSDRQLRIVSGLERNTPVHTSGEARVRVLLDLVYRKVVTEFDGSIIRKI